MLDAEDTERLIDPLDIGSHNAEVARQRAEAEQRLKAAPKQVRNPDGSWPTTECEECGEPIEGGRLDLGFTTCIECARLQERKDKLYAR